MGGDGFALGEYVTPRTGHPKSINFGTVAKAGNEVGCMLAESKRKAKNPGPEQYQQFINQDFNHQAKGGGFSKLDRGFGTSSDKNPAVGQYEISRDQVEPKLKGGTLPRKAKESAFSAIANKQSSFKQSPGKYDKKHLEPHLAGPQFQKASTESRLPKKPNQLAPGYYQIDHKHVEDRVPSYGGSKETGKTFMQMHIKGMDKMPGPGHHDIPDSKVHDRSGKRLHSARIVADRIISPRGPLAGH